MDNPLFLQYKKWKWWCMGLNYSLLQNPSFPCMFRVYVINSQAIISKRNFSENRKKLFEAKKKIIFR